MNRTIRTTEDVLTLLDGLFPPAAPFWDRFYADRSAGRPFFAPEPDENLASYLDRGLLSPGRVLDLGCGAGRNAIHLASLGFEVDAVDLSATAIAWAEERAREAGPGTGLRFHRADVFDAELPDAHYDLVYDSGCLHHLAPHRRVSYLALLDRVLAPGGHFGVTAFAAGAMGSERSDEELYRLGTLEGGLAYSPDELRSLFREFTPLEIRPMAAQAAGSGLFGVPFLLAALFRRTTHG
ncbi:class I SAM-dependent methyltransferase [Streptomyces sp. CBMA156]|uniref:class I SAM-dependent methyltransferase n=1 Tax=Streptomyces sp. CBMA156 TaxID=1930280 RepID=UPI001661C7E7|nr:class I SAM-dependent methyltransferase [Streptomyces sp. CBMA156]MBD0672129.1 SAM-dependent methyltransferase [Streptomyces sp. CBMA156]